MRRSTFPQDGVLRIDPAGWCESEVGIRGSLSSAPPWVCRIDALYLRWGRVAGASVTRLFGTAFYDGEVVQGLRAVRIDIRRHGHLLQVWLRLEPDGRVSRVTLMSSRMRARVREARTLRDDQAIELRSRVVAWLERAGCQPMRV